MALFEGLASRFGWDAPGPMSFRTLLRMAMRGNFGILCMILFASVFGMNSIYAILVTLLNSTATLFGKLPKASLPALPAAFVFSLCLLVRTEGLHDGIVSRQS